MSFRHDRIKRRQRQRFAILLTLIVLLLVFLVVVGSRSVVATGYRVATPFWQAKTELTTRFRQSSDIMLRSKKSLVAEIESLHQARQADHIALLRSRLLEQENKKLKSALRNEWAEGEWLVAGVLRRPPHTPYDVLVLDVGREHGVSRRQLVFSDSGLVLGVVGEVFENYSLVTMLSTPGIETMVMLAQPPVAVLAHGRGGGTYEIHVPRDISVNIGDQIVLPGVRAELVGEIQEISFDPRDPFQTAYVSAPVSFYEIGLVYVSERTLAEIPDIETVVVDSYDASDTATSTEEVTRSVVQ